MTISGCGRSDVEQSRLGPAHSRSAVGDRARHAFRLQRCQLAFAVGDREPPLPAQSTLEFARAKLFGPLGIRTDGALEQVLSDQVDAATLEAYQRASVAWPVDPQGYNYGAAFLRLPARDLAKLGYLYLNGGNWDGQQLIPADYVQAATSPYGSSPNLSMGYGWHWWVAVEGGHRTFSARGDGGQFIYVVPDLDLVTVVTGDPETSGLDPRIMILRTIVPAVTG